MYPICEVIWKDAWIDTDDITVADAKELKAIVRHTVGYLIEIKENEGLILCTDWYPDEIEYVNTPIVIPWGMVINYKTIDNTITNSFDKINQPN